MDPTLPAPLLGLLVGLAIGSFLNVVIHRLPRMMERRWREDVAQWLAEQEAVGTNAKPAGTESSPPYDLARPGSQCPACGHALRWYENIPVVSFVGLRGRCAACGQPIGWRYPLVELATGVLFALCLSRWGVGLAGWMWCAFAAATLALALIDHDTQLLPDDITLPLLWAGLGVAALGWNPALNLESALWGSVAGYLSLWGVYHLFKIATGKEGMGYGDFKLLAALGAWLGWQALLPIVLMASVAGAVVGLALRAAGRLAAGQALPFGPYLVAGAWVVGWMGPQRWSAWLGGWG